MNTSAFPEFLELQRCTFGDITLIWYEQFGLCAFTVVPTELCTRIPEHRAGLPRVSPDLSGFLPAVKMESCIQVKCSGDAYWDNFSPGLTMRNSASTANLTKRVHFSLQYQAAELTMSNPRESLQAMQRYEYCPESGVLSVHTEFTNTGSEPVTLDYTASACLGLLSPFAEDDGAERYEITRWHSWWSAEGRAETRLAEELGLEPSWQGYGVRNLRFSEHGTMPVRGYFPQIALRDRIADVTWCAAMETFGSWELELSRTGDMFCLTGGLPGRDSGGWRKTLQPGETFVTPAMLIACCAGDVQSAQNRLTRSLKETALREPESESDFPVVFNDWCANWGKPYPENVLPIAERLRDSGVRYFVLDDGWYRSGGNALAGIGEWQVAEDCYPGGIGALTRQLRDMGFIPGIWFEFEVVTEDTGLPEKRPERFLRLDGKVIRSGIRAFLDFRNPENIDILSGKVIDFLLANDFGYMKVDYNGCPGFGCDGDDSPAEAMRVHMECAAAFFRRIREELPDLVLEICSSGGHRLSPAWMKISSMESFSDVHEGVEIPIIAANTSLMIPPRSNQIWAVLHAADSDRRLCYSLTAAMMGRLCLSGHLEQLSEAQFSIVRRALAFQRKTVPLLLNGRVCVENRRKGHSYRHPRGAQIWHLSAPDGALELVVCHHFEGNQEDIGIKLPAAPVEYEVFCDESIRPTCDDSALLIPQMPEFSGCAVLLRYR